MQIHPITKLDRNTDTQEKRNTELHRYSYAHIYIHIDSHTYSQIHIQIQ